MRFITQDATRRLRFLISFATLMLQLQAIPALAQNNNVAQLETNKAVVQQLMSGVQQDGGFNA